MDMLVFWLLLDLETGYKSSENPLLLYWSVSDKGLRSSVLNNY